MFGFSFSELIVVVVVALVVMGPKDLPKMLRRLGQWAGKLRRAAADLRAQSGIDDALRSEGLADDLAEIRKLARGELDAVQRAARVDTGLGTALATATTSAAAASGAPVAHGLDADFRVARVREYPQEGADSYDALPDNAIVYAETLPRSRLARDPLYVMGDADAELPPEPDPAVAAAEADPAVAAAEADPAVAAAEADAEPAPVPYDPSPTSGGEAAAEQETTATAEARTE